MTVGLSQGEVDPFATVTHPVALRDGANRFALELTDLPVAAGRHGVWGTVTGVDGHALTPWERLCWLPIGGEELPPAPTGVARLAPLLLRSRLRRVDRDGDADADADAD